MPERRAAAFQAGRSKVAVDAPPREPDPVDPDYSAWVEPARLAVARVAARFRLAHADAEDLHGDLWVRLLANNGLLCRQFRHAASIETYLTTVATNLAIDRRRQEHGKWRPSADARREGPGAMELERLILRDGLLPEAALARLVAKCPNLAKASLTRFAQSIVPTARRRQIPVELAADQPSSDPSPDELMMQKGATRVAGSLATALNGALMSLCQADRNLIVWRYVDRRSVATLAMWLRVDQKQLYRRFQRLAKGLKTYLGAAGFKSFAVSELLALGCQIECASLHASQRRAATTGGRPPHLRIVARSRGALLSRRLATAS